MPAIPLHRPLSEPCVKMLGHDVPMNPKRTLRVGMIVREGQPDELVIAVGTGSGKDWREDPVEGIILPAYVLRQLREVLEALEAKLDQEGE
jgi:hypothetical protein